MGNGSESTTRKDNSIGGYKKMKAKSKKSCKQTVY